MPPKIEARIKGSYYVLIGGRDSGKTLICNSLAAEARARDMDVAGILTGLIGPELEAPRSVISLRTGATRLFATPAEKGSDPLTPRWELNPEVFEWAEEVLSTATPCDLLIIDEVGPLELVGGRGWAVALDVVREGDFGAALVVCRPKLLKKLERSLGGSPGEVFEADSEESVLLQDIILERMFDVG